MGVRPYINDIISDEDVRPTDDGHNTLVPLPTFLFPPVLGRCVCVWVRRRL